MGANCSASCALGCYVCCNRCQMDAIRNRFSFLPPDPPSYVITDAGRVEYLIRELKAHPLYRRAQEHAVICRLTSARGGKARSRNIFAALLRSPRSRMRHRQQQQRMKGAPHCPTTGDTHTSATKSAGAAEAGDSRLVRLPPDGAVILHCHGNATDNDMGLMLPVYNELAEELNVDVLGVEYSGFGPPQYEFGGSSSSTSGARTCARPTKKLVTPHFRDVTSNAEAAYNFLVEEEEYPPDKIILYGQSVGTGPVLELAAKVKCAGVILHSAMLSGIRVLDPSPDACCRPSSTFQCFDLFRNELHVQKVSTPIFFIHGRDDTVVPFDHGQKLFLLVPEKKRYPPYFPLGAGHNDVVESNPHAYYTVVDNFVRKVTSRNQEGGGGGSAAISRTSVDGAAGGGEETDCSSDFAAPVGGRLGPSQMQMGTQEQFEPFTSKIGLSVTVGPDDNRYADIRNKNALAGMQKL